MKMKSVVLLAMAIGCGLVAMLGVQQVLSGDKKPPVESGKVLVALTNIMPGQPLDDTNVVFKNWAKDQIPQGAVISAEQYAERSLRVAAVPNEVVMIAKLNEKGVFGGSSEIPKGMRVATVPVNVTKTHSGLILPGDRVDVVVWYNLKTAGFGQLQKTKTILQYIEVFATDNVRQSAVPNGEAKEIGAKNISLIVTPDQFNLLMLAEEKGHISLALRHRGDKEVVHPRDVDETMFDGVRPTRGSEKEDEDSGDDKGTKGEKRNVRTAPDKEKKDDKVAPTWTLKIYEGDKVREEEIQLPEGPAENGPNAEKTGGLWREFLKNMFRRPADGNSV